MKIFYLTVRERRPSWTKPHWKDQRLKERPEHPGHHLRRPRQYQLSRATHAKMLTARIRTYPRCRELDDLASSES